MNVINLILDLANKIVNEQITLDEAIKIIHSPGIESKLSKRILSKLYKLSNKLAIQSLHTTYYLVYLIYEATKMINNKKFQGLFAFTLANLSINFAEYHSAIELYQQSLSVFEELKDKQRIGSSLGSLGNVYNYLGQYQAAISYYNKALDIARETKDLNSECISLGNLGSAYESLGQYQKAIDFIERSLKIAKMIRNKKKIGVDLINLGNVHRSLGHYRKAIEYIEDGMKIVKKIGDRRSEGACLGNMGVIYESLGQHQKAIDYSEEALKIAKEIGDRHTEGRWLDGLGRAYHSLGQNKKAISYYLEALKIAKEIYDRKAEGSLLGGLGIVYNSLGQYHKAIYYHKKSLNIAKEVGDKKNEGAYFGNLSNTYKSLGQYEKAIDYSKEALKIHREIGDRQNEGRRLAGLGDSYLSLGQYQRAMYYYEEALKIAREIEDIQSEALSLHGLGNAYYSLTQYQNALDYYKEVLSIARETGDRNNEVMGLMALGRTLDSLGQFKRAITYNKEALKITREIGDIESEGACQCNLGAVYYSLKEYKKAISYFESGLKVVREIGNRESEGAYLVNIGVIYLSLGKYQKAIHYHKEALKIAKEVGNIDEERLVNFNLGYIYDENLIQPIKAYDYYKASIKLSEIMRGSLIKESHKLSFSTRIEEAYYNMVEICHKLKKEIEAYEYTERVKSRAFLDLLATTEISPKDDIPPDLKQKEEECLEQLKQFQIRSSIETITRTKEDISRKSEELNSVLKQIKKFDSEYAFLRMGKPFTFEQILDLLRQASGENENKNVVLVEYFVTENKIFIFVLRSDELNLYVEKVSLSSKRIYEFIEKYLKEVVNQFEYNKIRQIVKEISYYLIDPISKFLKGSDILYIIPHGILHYLPFQALNHNGQYLIQVYKIVYSPSASTIKYCQVKRRDQRKSCLSIGVDFEEEAGMVARLFNTSAYINKEVTKELVQKESRYKDIIHFSCHGFFNQSQPMSSGLILYNEHLTVSDIFNLRLNADLVTLSACETGINKQRPGDELIGLTRGFIYAGTSSVLVSLWAVEAKSTRLLMEKFYRYLLDNKMSKAEALQNAQLEIMELIGYKHPYFWAPFILVGDWK